jgi:hypothetical protein
MATTITMDTKSDATSDSNPTVARMTTQRTPGRPLHPSRVPGGGSCERCIQTLLPTSTQLGLAIQHTPNSSSTQEGTQQGASLILAAVADEYQAGGTPVVLAVWNHHRIAALAEVLGAPAAEIPNWDDADFDTVYELVYHGSALTSFNVKSEGFHTAIAEER